MDFTNITSWSQLILAIAVAILTVVIIPMLPKLKDFIIAYIQAKIDAVQASKGNETTAHYVKILDNLIYDVVNGLNQTLVDGLKEQAVDGKLTDAQIEQLKSNALNEVLGHLTDAAKAALAEVYTDLVAIIQTKIQSNVRDAKVTMLKGETLSTLSDTGGGEQKSDNPQ